MLVVGALFIGLASLPLAAVGVVQLAGTIAAQLGGPAEVTDFLSIWSGPRLLVSSPVRLYAPGAAAAEERSLSGTDRFDRPFSFMPHAALLLAPLGLLPYGVAYAIWLVVGICSVGLSVRLLAPASRLWPGLLVLFFPVQLALIMGQTAPLTLLAFCGLVRLVDRRPALAGLLMGLSPATWKPQLLMPAVVVAFAAARQWRVLGWLLATPVLLCSLVVAIAGLQLVGDYQAQAAAVWALVNARNPVESAGQTLLGLAQTLVGPGTASVLVAVLGGAGIELTVAAVWWAGLRQDGRRLLQLAILPIAAVLAAPHALDYDLTLWLASAWLLLRYASGRAEVRPLVVGLCLTGWAVSNLVVLTENDAGFPWAVPPGLVMLGSIAWLYSSHPQLASITGRSHVSGLPPPPD